MANGPKSDLQAEFLLEDDSASSSNGSGDPATAKAVARRDGSKGSGRPADPVTVAEDAPATPPEEPATDPAGEGAAEELAAPVDEGPRVLRYVIGAEGAWKELEDGSREPLNEDEWRTALARHFRRETTAAT